MKLRYLFSIILSSVLLFSSCEEQPTESWDNIKLDKTYLSISEEGGTATLKVEATEDWEFVVDDVWPEVIKRDKEGNVESSTPSWLAADKMSGAAGETTVTFTAEATTSGRELELQIKAGENTQFIRVRQGSMTVTKATVAEIIAGPEGKLYEVTGICTAVANTTYGNWYLKDSSTDDQLYIYGTVDASGKYNWSSFNIEVGDEVTVQGSYVLYGGNTPEFVDATFIKVTKSLVKVVTESATVAKEGGELELMVAYKGAGVFPTVPEEFRSWISVVDMQNKPGEPTKIEPNPADTAVVKIAVLPNEGGNREGSVTFVSSGSSVPYTFVQEGAIIETTADQINAAEDGSTLYRITGCVKSIKNSKYGNLYISDYTGEVYVYGTYDAEGNRFDAFTTPINEGDIVTVCGVKGSYKDSPQMVNVVVEKHVPVATVTVAEFLAAPEAADVYYRLTGTMANIVMDKNDPTLQNVYGNFDIVDESGSVYVYGLLQGWGGPSKMFRELNLAEGDKLTLIGTRTAYKGTPQVGNAFYVSHEEGAPAVDPWETAETYLLPESASSSRQVLREMKYYADANNVNVRLTASAAKITETATNYVTIMIYDTVTGTSGAGFYGWWNDAKGNTEFAAEHCGVVSGTDLTLNIGGTDVAVEKTEEGDVVTWTFAIPRSVSDVLKNSEAYVGILAMKDWDATGAMPDKYADMLKVTLP